MGVIWIQTDEGNLIHIPVVGGDINTPDSPTKIPASIFAAAMNRTLDGQYVVDVPGVGVVTVDLDPPGRTGTCNQCGECCGDCPHLVGKKCGIRAEILQRFKGCVLFPEKASDVAGCPSCGFTFGS